MKHLHFRGLSTADFEGVTVASADYGDLEAKRSDEDIAGRDGGLTSHANGRHYKSRTMTYVLNVKATPTTIEAQLSALRAWLSGGGSEQSSDRELSDDFNVGWVWANADFVSAHTDYLDMFRGVAQLTVKMTADPRAVKAGTVCDRVFKGTSRGGGTLTVTGNAAWSWAHNDTTETGTYTAASPYKYRLEAFAENAVTATLNGAPLTIGTAFTMPASATIVITLAGAGGIGYYELWHDTREVRV